MATITKFTDSTQKHEILPGYSGYLFNVIDFGLQAVAQNDVVQALKVPANCLIKNVRTVVATAEGAICTSQVGDGDGATGWDASVNLNAAANTATAGASGTDANVTTGKFYAADDTIDLTMQNAAATAKLYVFAAYERVPAN